MQNRVWQTNSKRNLVGGVSKDRCYTPPYALDPLWEHLPKDRVIWEPAAGKNYLVATMTSRGYKVNGTEIYQGVKNNIVQYDQHQNFFNLNAGFYGDIHVTNPPYSIVFDWMEKCYTDNTPFALLIKLMHIGAAKAQKLMEKYGAEIILLDKRVDFEMPNTKFEDSNATWPVIWFTHGLNIGKEITYGKITTKPTKRNVQTS